MKICSLKKNIKNKLAIVKSMIDYNTLTRTEVCTTQWVRTSDKCQATVESLGRLPGLISSVG